ncbi:hypothetical protein [Bradyrhizobium viridifuturi]|uniref:hypothetical protein n=1 Tax=Bradyrhizobium viridifuturi TaxID=1654716 RepID=UPI000AED4C88|nr:hypothetical protein [Bradyrhizobium viridifuturi]
MGKGFAYWGYRPLFVGEIAFLAGVFVLLRSGCLLAVFASGPSLVLAVAMGWALLRTFPYLDIYGFDALRDSVILVYGVFSFVVAALLIEDFRRIDTVIGYYRKFLDIYVPVVPILFPLSFYFADYIPDVPGTDVGLIWLGAGEVATHLAGAPCSFSRACANQLRSGRPVSSREWLSSAPLAVQPFWHLPCQSLWRRWRSVKCARSSPSSRPAQCSLPLPMRSR